MTVTEVKALIYICTSLLAVIAFIGALFVKSFMRMAQDISEIKSDVKVAATKHDGLEHRVEKIEAFVYHA